jgi:hypothetical protein
MSCSTGRTFALFPGRNRKYSICQPVFTEDMKLGSFWANCVNWHAIVLLFLRQETEHKFCCHSLICKSSIRIFWHVPNSTLTFFATFLIVRRRSARMISRTHATFPSVWEVDGLPGRWSSSKDRCPLLKREYHSIVFDRLRQDSPKAACSISHVSVPDFPRRKQKSMHTHCCTFSSNVRCDAHFR